MHKPPPRVRWVYKVMHNINLLVVLKIYTITLNLL